MTGCTSAGHACRALDRARVLVARLPLVDAEGEEYVRVAAPCGAERLDAEFVEGARVRELDRLPAVDADEGRELLDVALVVVAVPENRLPVRVGLQLLHRERV